MRRLVGSRYGRVIPLPVELLGLKINLPLSLTHKHCDSRTPELICAHWTVKSDWMAAYPHANIALIIALSIDATLVINNKLTSYLVATMIS